MGFQVIDDLKKADELAKAGLLWYGLPDHSNHSLYVAVPWPKKYMSPTESRKEYYTTYTFLLLVEE